APSQMLENDARNAVYEHVKAHPGAHPSAIAETLNLGWGTVVYHLGKLEATKLVTSRNAHNRRCYFALTSDLDVDARTAVAAMSTDKARAIVDVVRASPGISQKDLSERLGISQALASWHVKRLVESGVLTVGREGRSNTLRVAGHVPVLVAACSAGRRDQVGERLRNGQTGKLRREAERPHAVGLQEDVLALGRDDEVHGGVGEAQGARGGAQALREPSWQGVGTAPPARAVERALVARVAAPVDLCLLVLLREDL